MQKNLTCRKNRRRLITASRSAQLFESLETRQLMSTALWTGAGSNTNWSTPGNWAGGKIPGESDVALFSAGGNVNSKIDAAYTAAHPKGVRGVNLVAGYKKTLEIASSLSIGELGLRAFDGAVKLDAGVTVKDNGYWTTAGASADVSMGSLEFTPGTEATLDPGASSTMFKSITVDAGAYVGLENNTLVTGSLTTHGGFAASDDSITVLGQLIVSGSGASYDSSNGFDSYGSIQVSAGARFQLNTEVDTAALSIDSTSKLVYDNGMIVVSGAVSVSTATFETTTYAHANGDVTLIKQTSNVAPPITAFSNLPEGAPLDFAARHLTTTYVGGDGNDLVFKNEFATPTISYTAFSQAEGDSGITDFVVAFNRTGDTSQPSTVHYATTDFTSLSSGPYADYQSTSGDLVFGVGETIKTVVVHVNGDTISEASNDLFQFKLTNPNNAIVGGANFIGINDDDAKPAVLPVISIANLAQAEGNGYVNSEFKFVVTRTGDLSAETPVFFKLDSGTADAGYDFYSIYGLQAYAVFEPGESTAFATVQVVADDSLEADETFTVTLNSAPNATIDPTKNVAIGTILNDDVAQATTISINDVAAFEGDVGVTPFVFTVTRSGDLSKPETIDYDLDEGTSYEGADFAGDYGTINFAAGQSKATITAYVVGNTKIEGSRTFFVGIRGKNVVDYHGEGTIQDDDSAKPLPSISVASVMKNEGNSGTTTFAFTITRTGDLTTQSTVLFQTSDGSANGSDYTGVSKTLTFAPNQASVIFNVNVKGDTSIENDETFDVKLSSATNATITQANAIGTIVNDDKDSSSVAVVKDLNDGTKTMLKILGTAANDVINVVYGGAQGKADVTINGVKKGTFKFTGGIYADALAGADAIMIDAKINRHGWLFGSAGNDTINGGGGPELIFGGAGDDKLFGNAGRDIVIGGDGADTVNGGDNEDIVLAGGTKYDGNITALNAIAREWNRTDHNYAQRVVEITKGTGYTNGNRLDGSTADSGATPADMLTGGSGLDLFYLNLDTKPAKHDVVTDLTNGETKVGVFA